MSNLLNFIDKFEDAKIMVIGDIIADEFLIGRPERLSREAPVLILRRNKRKILPGGAANAAYNISSLKGNINLVGVIGNDLPGKRLKDILEKNNIDISGIFEAKNRPTSLKTRVLAGGNQVVKQQIVRIDHLEESYISENLEEKILDNLRKNINKIDGVLLSDYGNGVFSSKLKKEVIKIAGENDVFTAVDSRYDLLDFKKASLATPNLEEAGNAVGKTLKTQKDVIKAGNKLIKELDLENLLITQGSEGMTLFNNKGSYNHIPVANFSEVYDVTGAGDTVIATLVLTLAAGAPILSAVRLANYAAGIVVRKSGVAVVKPEELRNEVLNNEK
ncbi:MAG: bifunctional heptose 7-phosphate kinase/heptose 1-phosphate adenyltransferase [Bacillota bacterium]